MSDKTIQILRDMAKHAEAMASRYSPGSELSASLRRLQAAIRDASAVAAVDVGRRIPVRDLAVIGKTNGEPSSPVIE